MLFDRYGKADERLNYENELFRSRDKQYGSSEEILCWSF